MEIPKICSNIPASENQLINVHSQKIATIFHQFKMDGDLSGLDSALVCKGEIEKTYQQLWQTKQVKAALEFKKAILDPAEQQLQVMNAASKKLTTVDLRNIGTFFTPPVELFYQDEETGLAYHKPDSSKLLKGVGQFLLQGLYQGCGLNKESSLIHPKKKVLAKCDVLYFKKLPDQPSKSGFWNLFGKRNDSDQRQLQRNEFLLNAERWLEQKIDEWNYESFVFADSQKLIEMGMPDEAAAGLDALVLFHKLFLNNEEEKN